MNRGDVVIDSRDWLGIGQAGVWVGPWVHSLITTAQSLQIVSPVQDCSTGIQYDIFAQWEKVEMCHPSLVTAIYHNQKNKG